MGTRSLTHVIEKWKDETGLYKKQTLLTMYRQMDGYPEGMGVDLANFLMSGTVVNGIPMNADKRLFNGAGCLAAQLVTEFKTGSGGIYIVKPNSKGHGECYTYEIVVNDEDFSITLNCYENGYIKNGKYHKGAKLLFSGTPERFNNWVEEQEKLNN